MIRSCTNEATSRAAVTLLLLGLLSTATNGRLVAADQSRENGAMVQLARTVAESINGSVVQVLCGGRAVALGTVVSEDGYVLTKRSELTGDPVRVRLQDRRLLPARVAAVRGSNDLALLKVETDQKLQPVEFSTVVPPIASFLFTPDRTGRPIGIGAVGTAPRRINDDGRLGVKLEHDSRGRARVDMVNPNSGAEKAGVKRGDVIIGIDGQQQNSLQNVFDSLRGMYPGDIVRLAVQRTSDVENDGVRSTETIEIDAQIMEYALMIETDSDTHVNGLRSARLSGFDLVIQHDTVLAPYECGGPCLDSAGRVVGINIARAGRVVSYSLPSSLVQGQLNSMLNEVRQQ